MHVKSLKSFLQKKCLRKLPNADYGPAGILLQEVTVLVQFALKSLPEYCI